MSQSIQLPVLDLQNDRSSSARMAQAFYQALHETGFVYVVGHGIDSSYFLELERLSRLFFSQSESEKMKIAMKQAKRAWRGYFPPGAELTLGQADQKEGIYFAEEHSQGHPLVLAEEPFYGSNQWPANPKLKEFPQLVTNYMDELKGLGTYLMSLLAIALCDDTEYFQKRFSSEPTTLFRIFNYPESHNQSSGWGVGEHTDMGFLTILKTDSKSGLEIKLKGSWIEAPPLKNGFVVNIGDMLELWTHGLLRATPHRVRRQEKGDRLSFPYFFDPHWQAKLQRIPKEQLIILPPKIQVTAKSRWDGLQLEALEGKMTYGEFVWNKVKDVFPELSQGLAPPS